MIEAPRVKDRVSDGEWRARVELAALYRLMDHFRWTDSIFTHISLRVPGEETFLINPLGYLYAEMTASLLLKVDGGGKVVDDPTGLGAIRAGLIIHGAIHLARPDIGCVIHTHTRAGIAVSALEDGLLPISQHAAAVIGRVAYHDFEGIAVRPDEQVRMVANLGGKAILILRNHGLLVTGRSAAEAFALVNIVERACEVQLAATGSGARLRHIDRRAIDQTVVEMDDSIYQREWAAMLRLVERVAPDYKN